MDTGPIARPSSTLYAGGASIVRLGLVVSNLGSGFLFFLRKSLSFRRYFRSNLQ